MDDVFIALKKISKDLPKRKTITKKINNTNFNDIINYPLVINSNIPPYNQSAMDGIAVKSKELNYRIKGKTYLSIVTFHPAYLLRQPDQKKYSWADLKEIKNKINELNIII